MHTSPRELRVTSPIVSVLTRDPLPSHQVHKGSISTHRLLVHSSRRLGRLLLEALHLCLPHRQRRRSCRQRCAAHRGLAHPHSHQFLKQLARRLKRHPACQPRQQFLPTRRQPSTQQP